MNIIAIDIGNSTITIGLFVENNEKFIETVDGNDERRLSDLLTGAWEQIPFARSDKVHVRDGVIVVSSVKPAWADVIKKICE